MTAGAPPVQRDVAVLGIACRFPDSEDVDAFWSNLRAGRCAVRRLSSDEQRAAEAVGVDTASDTYVPTTLDIPDLDAFDHTFFGMSERQARLMDPQQRLFLQECWHALEDAEMTGRLEGRQVSVFAGATPAMYPDLFTAADFSREGVSRYSLGLGNEVDYLASQVSYKLDLTGAAFSVSSACSTSLTAVHLAVRALRAGDCDLAIAGGVSLRLPAGVGHDTTRTGVESPDGLTRAYSAERAGTGFGSGVGVVVLARADQAHEFPRPPRAFIAGTGLSNDGAAKSGFSAPGLRGQVAALRAAYADASLDVSTVGYFEGHGTATSVGDDVETAALAEVLPPGRRCLLGSVKGNIGHLDAAAGVAGLIKAVLAVQHGYIPESLNSEPPLPALVGPASRLEVASRGQSWSQKVRVAGVSSFGFGGSNAHIVVRSASTTEVAEPLTPVGGGESDELPELLLLTARSGIALDRLTEEHAKRLDCVPGAAWTSYARSSRVGRAHLPLRRSIAAVSPSDAARQLRQAPHRMHSPQASSQRSTVVFAVPGQGTQYLGLARELYQRVSTFRRSVDRLSSTFKQLSGVDPAASMLGRPAHPDLSVEDTLVAQPLLTTIAIAIHDLLAACGVVPDAYFGNSIGELVGAHLAGLFSEETLCMLVAERARLMQAQPRGAMAAVIGDLELVRSVCGAEITLAVITSSTSAILSGPEDALLGRFPELERNAVAVRRLPVSHAYHSIAMEGAAGFAHPFDLASLSTPERTRPWVSNSTGAWCDPNEASSPDYWARQLLDPVQLADGAATLLSLGPVTTLTLGPGSSMSSVLRAQSETDTVLTCIDLLPPAAARGRSDTTFLAGLGLLWETGASVDLDPVLPPAESHGPTPAQPLYPFDKARHWAPSKAAYPTSAADAQSADAAGHGTTHRTPDRSDVSVWVRTSGELPRLPVGAPVPAAVVHGTTESARRLRTTVERVVTSRRSHGHRTVHFIELASAKQWSPTDAATAVTNALRDVEQLVPDLGRDNAVLLVTSGEGTARGIGETLARCMNVDGVVSEASHIHLAGEGPSPTALRRLLQAVEAGTVRRGDSLDLSGPQLSRSLLVEQPVDPIPVDTTTLGPRRYLVTGGAGRVALDLVDRLLRRGDSVVVVTRPPTATDGREVTTARRWRLDSLARRYPAPQFSEVRADLRSSDSLVEVVSNACGASSVDVVLHMAASRNLHGTRELDQLTLSEDLTVKLSAAVALTDWAEQHAVADVVLFSSLSALDPFPRAADYALSNAVLEGFARQHQQRSTAVRVTTVQWGVLASSESDEETDTTGQLLSGGRELELDVDSVVELLDQLPDVGEPALVALSGSIQPGLLADSAGPSSPARAGGPATADPATSNSAAAVWTSILGLSEGSREADFFQAGGDSLLAVQLLSAAKSAGLRAVTYAEFIVKPTLAHFEELVDPTTSTEQ